MPISLVGNPGNFNDLFKGRYTGFFCEVRDTGLFTFLDRSVTTAELNNLMRV